MYTYYIEDGEAITQLSRFASWSGAMINSQWLELPMSRTKFHGPKYVRVIEDRLYLVEM